MKILMTVTLALMMTAVQFSAPAMADKGGRCDTRMLAGRWLFATGIGHQQLGAPAPPSGDITAIGTMNIDRDGALEGKFDVTFEGAGFLSGILYSGTARLNADCTGTLSFVTETGTVRTDSIALVEDDLFWAMSQDPLNLWTYKAKRISRSTK